MLKKRRQLVTNKHHFNHSQEQAKRHHSITWRTSVRQQSSCSSNSSARRWVNNSFKSLSFSLWAVDKSLHLCHLNNTLVLQASNVFFLSSRVWVVPIDLETFPAFYTVWLGAMDNGLRSRMGLWLPQQGISTQTWALALHPDSGLYPHIKQAVPGTLHLPHQLCHPRLNSLQTPEPKHDRNIHKSRWSFKVKCTNVIWN